jgi:iron complex transport system ATP-binding protein
MFTIQQLTTGFNHKLLHKDIDLSMQPGEILLLVGSNGIGKSVLLRTLLNIHKPLSGTWNLDQYPLHNKSSKDLSNYISLLLPTPPSIENLSSTDIVISGRQRFLKPWTTSESQFDFVRPIFNKIGIPHLWDKPFATLSDGEKQKVMLARCLAQETPIILLDEPMAFLDYPSRKEFLSLISTIARTEHKYILLSTHDIEISLPCANLVLHLLPNEFRIYNNPSSLTAQTLFPE